MLGERPGHTLQTTALINEAYLRLVDASQVAWENRAHFLAVSANLIRRILVDFARSRAYQKHGGHAVKVDFDEGRIPSSGRGADVIAVDEALEALKGGKRIQPFGNLASTAREASPPSSFPILNTPIYSNRILRFVRGGTWRFGRHDGISDKPLLCTVSKMRMYNHYHIVVVIE